MTRLFLLLSSLSLVLVTLVTGPSRVHAALKGEEALREGCTWLDRTLVREPERDDAFGMFMRGLMPKCHALLEALARGDKSVRAEGLNAVVSEINELRSVIDAELGGPPPATGKPTPDEVAKKKVADERAGIDADRARELEEKSRVAEEVKRLEAEKKAGEEAVKQAEKEARAREQAEKREAERRAKETDRERKAREAAEKKAELDAKKQAERLRKEQEAAEKTAELEAKKEAKAREAAEKTAELEAKKEAEGRAKAQALEEAEARRLIEEAEREGVEAFWWAAGEKAAALVNAELASAGEEARAERERVAAENSERVAAEEVAREAGTAKTALVKQPRAEGKLDGTWEQPARKSLDRTMKRTLNIFTRDGKVQGELLEEVSYPAPTAWVDRSCEGNPTFRMVTSARVSGEAGKSKLVLWRDVPRVLTCTCPSRCTVETRRRGFDLAIGPNGAELSDASGVFVRPGTVIVGTKGEVALEKGRANAAPVVEVSPTSFAGVWETEPFKSRDQTLVRRLEIKLEGDKFVGTLVERSSQGLPLQSWSERFCAGAPKWEWVTQWVVDGGSKGTGLSLRGQKGSTLSCSCASKCAKPKDKMTFKGELGTTGETLSIDGELYEKK